MTSENFIEFPTKNGMVTVAKNSIASIEQGANQIGAILTLKEKRLNGDQITFIADITYTYIVSEINKFEKLNP